MSEPKKLKTTEEQRDATSKIMKILDDINNDEDVVKIMSLVMSGFMWACNRNKDHDFFKILSNAIDDFHFVTEYQVPEPTTKEDAMEEVRKCVSKILIMCDGHQSGIIFASLATALSIVDGKCRQIAANGGEEISKSIKKVVTASAEGLAEAVSINKKEQEKEKSCESSGFASDLIRKFMFSKPSEN